MKIRKILVFVFLIGSVLSACSPAILAKNTPLAASSGQTPTFEFHPSQDGSQVQQPSPVTSVDSTETSAPASSLPPAAAAAQQKLAAQLGVNSEKVTVVSAEPVQWRDGCLGVALPGMMCTQVITPGYRIILSADGKQYEYHTNETGSTVLPAVAALPKTANKVVVWQQSAGGVCSRVEIGPQSVAYGPCGSQLKETALPAARMQELNYFTSTYTSFSQETRAGTIELTGTGQHIPVDAEKRSVAEWAALVNMEAQSGRSGAAWGSALAWHREGGIAGFCDDLVVYLTGWAVANSCKANQQGGTIYRLSAGELEKIYSWIDAEASFDYERKDSATADAMLVRLSFMGKGSQTASAAQQEEIGAFATQIFTNAQK